MTEAEYWQEVQHLSREIEDAVAIYNTLEGINEAAVGNPKIEIALNKNALFWNVQVASLQAFLFIILGRIFDPAHDAHSIRRLVGDTVAHFEFFSKNALIARKEKNGITGRVLDEFLRSSVYFPIKAGDLRYLKKELASHSKKFEQIYQPIRHTVIAHRIVTDIQEVSKLFAATNRVELGKIVDFLNELIDGIWHLYQNGRKPEFGTHTEYFRQSNHKIRDEAAAVLNRVAGISGLAL